MEEVLILHSSHVFSHMAVLLKCATSPWWAACNGILSRLKYMEAPDHDTCQKYVSQVVDVIKAQGYSV